jgi:hypothetical protein
MVRTSFRNCFSPTQRRHSSFFTATATRPPGSVTLYSDPKLPPPSFSEKFLVALLTSPYLNATRLPPSDAACRNVLLLCRFLYILTTTNTMIDKARIDATAAMATKTAVLLRPLEEGTSMADTRR